MTFLDIKKHEFYFALKNGTPITTHDNGNMPAEVFVDIYVGEAERARIRQATAIRKSWQAAAVANAAGKEVDAP